MVWQDIALVVANIIFVGSLVPQVLRGFLDRKKYIVFQTAFIITIALAIQTYVLYSLGLLFTTIMVSMLTTMWAMLMYQSIFYEAPALHEGDDSKNKNHKRKEYN